MIGCLLRSRLIYEGRADVFQPVVYVKVGWFEQGLVEVAEKVTTAEHEDRLSVKEPSGYQYTSNAQPISYWRALTSIRPTIESNLE